MIKVFISSTTNDLGSYRTVAREILNEKDHIIPVEQQSFDLDYRKVTAILNANIAECDAVICLVGFSYGHEPISSSFDDRRRSYSQMEYDIAKRKHKPTYVFVATDDCQFDNPIQESHDLAELQSRFRRHILGGSEIYYQFSSHAELAEQIARIKFPPPPPPPPDDDRRSSNWIVFLALLTLVGLLGYWFYFRPVSNSPAPLKSSNAATTNSVTEKTIATTPSDPEPPVDRMEPVVAPEQEAGTTVATISAATSGAANNSNQAGSLRVTVSIPNFDYTFIEVSVVDEHGSTIEAKRYSPLPKLKRYGTVNFYGLNPGSYLIAASINDSEKTNDWSRETRKVTIASGSNSAELILDWIRFQYRVEPRNATIAVSCAPAFKPLPSGEVWEQKIRPGNRIISISSGPNYTPWVTNITVSAAGPRSITSRLSLITFPIPGAPWTASSVDLNLSWVSNCWIGKTEVTRGQYAKFVENTGHGSDGTMMCLGSNGFQATTNSWNHTPFEQADDHPVIGVNLGDARAFCKWLTEIERKAGRLSQTQRYRLPKLFEMDVASKNLRRIRDRANLAGQEIRDKDWPTTWNNKYSILQDHSDKWPRTSPAGKSGDIDTTYGICDLIGNVSEWTEDPYRKESNLLEIRKVDREYFDADGDGISYQAIFGPNWCDHDHIDIDLRVRHKARPDDKSDRLGFRVVIAEDSAPR